MSGTVKARPERLDDRRASRCDRAVLDGVRAVAGGAAERADVAVQDRAGDEAILVLQTMGFVHDATLAVGTTQGTRLCTTATLTSTA